MGVVAKVFKSFPYEHMMIYLHSEGTPHSLRVLEVPRSWVKGLEDELIQKSGVQRDNKIGFIFQEHHTNLVTAILFWDSKCTSIQWHPEFWEDTPVNLECRLGCNAYGRVHPSPADLGLV